MNVDQVKWASQLLEQRDELEVLLALSQDPDTRIIVQLAPRHTEQCSILVPGRQMYPALEMLKTNIDAALHELGVEE